MRRWLILLGCLLAGGIAGYLLGGGGDPPRPGAGDATDRDPDESARLREERDRLRTRVAALRNRRQERQEGRRDRSLDPVRQVRETAEKDAATVRLLVLGTDGKGLAGRKLWLSNYKRGFRREVESDDKGIAEVEGVPPGPLRVSVRLEERGRTRSLEVDLAGGFLTEILVTAPEGSATVSGTVRDRKAGPLADVNVALSAESGIFEDHLQTETDANGRYRFESVAAGPWALRAFGTPIDRNHDVAAEIEVPDGGDVRQDLLFGTVSLTGLIHDATSGAGIPGAMVRLSGETGMRQATADEQGRYRLRDLRPGRWEVEVIAFDHVRFFGGPIEARRGETERLDVAMTAAVDVVIVILDAQGRPVTGRVGILFYAPGSVTSSPYSHLGLATEAGEIRYRELPPGEFMVRAAAGGKRGTARHRFVEGRENRVVVRLPE